VVIVAGNEESLALADRHPRRLVIPVTDPRAVFCQSVHTNACWRLFLMKPKLVALILALTVMSWAQSTTPAPTEQNSTPAKASCSCCEKMASADHKDMACSKHKDASAKDGKEVSCCAGRDAKDAASCCSGKDAKSCSKGDKASASCCGTGKPGDGHEMACCAKDGKDDANACCSGKQCEKHTDHPTPGN
jgi:hypothetical protein